MGRYANHSMKLERIRYNYEFNCTKIVQSDLKKSQEILKTLLGIDKNKNLINIFTDGSHLYKNGGRRIGYSFVVEYDENVCHIQNGKLTIGKTKRRLGALYAEAVACIKALEYILKKQLDHVMIYTDSKYLYKSLKNNHIRINPVTVGFINKVISILKDIKSSNLHVDFLYIAAHSNKIGNEGNNIADRFARQGRKGKPIASDNILWINNTKSSIDENISKMLNGI